MKPHIYKFLISLCFVAAAFNATAQKAKSDSIKTNRKFFQNFRLETDLVPFGMLAFGKSESYSFDAAVQTSFLSKYYPILEVGFAGADKTVSNGINFHTSGPFARLGMDFNLIKNKPGKKTQNNFFLAGVRIGASSFEYELNNITLTQNYWEETLERNYDHIRTTKAWFEIVAGVRVEIAPKVYMGWSVRNKNRIGQSNPGTLSPWYIPGFGKNKSSNWGVNYAIGYLF